MGDVRPALIAVATAVLLLPFIACVNVGGLLLRVAARTRELSIRRALGATTAGVVGLVALEGAALAAAGGVAAFPVARALVRLLLALAPARMPGTDQLRGAGLPAPVAAGVTILALLTLGIIPAIVAKNIGSSLRPELGDRSASASRARLRLRNLLVGSQVALAVVLLAGAGLVLRTLRQLERVDLGYVPDHLSVVSISLPAGSYDWSGPKMLALGDQLMARWRALPGVEELTPIAVPPFYGPNVLQTAVHVEGQEQRDSRDQYWVPMEEGGSDYFRTLGVSLLRGRAFRENDREDAPLVAIVSQAVARRLWPNQDPIGKHIRYWQQDTTAWRTVIGVAGDMRWRSLRDATPSIYLPWRQGYWQGGFAVRSHERFPTLMSELRSAARDIDPRLDLWASKTLEAELAGPLAQPRLTAYLLSAFGVVAMLLAAIGLYGAMASIVRARTRDIGVKMALGASPGRVRGEMLGEALSAFVPGAAVGIIAALVLARLITSLLYEISPSDPTALLGACVALAVVAMAAAYLPTRRATRIDPAAALRSE